MNSLRFCSSDRWEKPRNKATKGWEKTAGNRYFTISWNDAQSNGVSRFLNEVDDVWMRLVGDGAPIDGQDAIAYFQLATAVCGTPFNNPTYFVRHGHTCISRFCIGLGVVFFCFLFCFVCFFLFVDSPPFLPGDSVVCIIISCTETQCDMKQNYSLYESFHKSDRNLNFHTKL